MPLRMVFTSVVAGLDEIIIGRMLAGKYRMIAAVRNAREILRLFDRRRYRSAPHTPQGRSCLLRKYRQRLQQVLSFDAV